MINLDNARRYCCEKISLIENYDKAKKDLLEMWHLHHRKEEEGYSRKELIDSGMYYKRPASELIFLTHAEHKSIHSKGKKYFLGKKISEAMNGNKHCLGKTGEKHPCSKQVNQIDKKTGQIIKTWPCTREVERVLRINNGHISSCCSGQRKSAGGYVWKYADI